MKVLAFATTSLMALTLQPVQAASLDITISNLTQGIYFTPLLVTAHAQNNHLFELGTTATTELQMMAEGGDISGLSMLADTMSADKIENPAAGLLAPSQSTMTMLETTDGNTMLSVTAMILPSNDGFVGLDSWEIPSEPGTYNIFLNAYDAGTEANDELVVEGSGAPGVLGIPASPGENGGTMGSGVTSEESNTKVHIHRGTLGDDDHEAGKSDLNNTVHRWLNPVAKITVTVN